MDPILMLAQSLLIGFSIVGIVAADPEGIGYHLLTLGVAVIGTLAASRLPPSWLVKHASWFFVGGLITLALVLIFGVGPESDQGARRWLVYEFSKYDFKLSVQPSEFMKIALVLYLASFFSRRGVDYPIIGPMIAIGLAAGMVAAETDISTAIFLMMLAFYILVIIGVPFRRLLAIAILVLLLTVSIHGLIQRNRFKHFSVRVYAWMILNQETPLGKLLHFDPNLLETLSQHNPQQALAVKRALEQPRRSRNAIKAAGPFGHGPGARPPQAIYEGSNDMIFATITYAVGWFGAAILLLAYALVFARGMQIAAKSAGAVSVVALGLTGYITMQALLNITVATSVIPVTGISLPMVSSGGSSLLAAGLAFGILNAISRQVMKPEAAK